MLMFRNAATLAFKLGAGILIFSSCDNLGSDCEYLKSCPPGGAGGAAGGALSGGSGGTSALGGSSAASGGGTSEAGASSGGADGGAAGASGAAGSAGVGGTPPCDGACGGATPNCEPISNACVECLSKGDCASPKPVCDTSTNTCEQCLARADCKAPTPACDATTNTCVECLTKTDCKGATPLCDATTNTCVECLEQADCTESTASQCDLTDHACKPCTLDAECSDIDGKGVCLAGTCVECTATKAAACGNEQDTPFVCDSLKHTCTTEPARSAGLCQPCVADAQCARGELCVLDTLGSGTTQKSVGYFCHWKQGDTDHGAPADCPTEGRPYVRLLTDVISIDGETADICALAVSSCPANNEFRDKNCAPSGTPDDALCGISSPDDARCVQFGAGFRCTMTCLSHDDCPNSSTCNTAVNPRVCTL